MIDFHPENKKTNISEALRYFTNAIKKRSISFVISDFIDTNYEDALKISNRKHDVVAIRIYDRRENELPNIGMVRVKDAETGELTWLDSSSSNVRNYYKARSLQFENELRDRFNRSGVDFTKIATNESYVRPLMHLFKRRESRM